jgi:cytochrome c oxidase subunit 4
MDTMSEHQPTSLRVYLAVFVSLLALTWLTVWVAQHDLGDLNIVIAVVIATLKAGLVVLFFMHLLHDRPINAVVLGFALFMLGLLISLSLLDTGRYQHTLTPQVNEQLQQPR